MKKWFMGLERKSQKHLTLGTWAGCIVLFFLLGCLPPSGFDTILLLGFFATIVFGILFAVWSRKAQRIRKNAKRKAEQRKRTPLTTATPIAKNTSTATTQIGSQTATVSSQPVKPIVAIEPSNSKRKIRLTVIDVETPNNANNRVCSIGIVAYENSEIVYKRSILVNPEVNFDELNMRIHGITPKMVENAPNLSAVWNQIDPYIINSVIVGHNVRSDLAILSKALASYGLRLPTITYVDTMNLAKRYLDKSSYKLADLVADIDAERTAHDALSDCLDCKLLLDSLQQKYQFNIYAITEEFYIEHPLYEPPQKKKSSGMYRTAAPSTETIAYKKLQELAEKIVEDNKITENEIAEFIRMVEENNAQQIHPISIAYEKAKRHSSAEEIVEVLSTIKGDIRMDTFDRIFEGKLFCLTGDFIHGSKLDVETYITSKGGLIKETVTHKVDYLVRGSKGSNMYAYGTYGGKVKKAMENQSKGLSIKIISENDIY